VDIRRPEKEISGLDGRQIDAVIPQDRRGGGNIVISRRKAHRAAAEDKSARRGWTGDRRGQEGDGQNIADFGAFIDLGGIDGLLHITDNELGRINHPSDIPRSTRRSRVKILAIDRRRRRLRWTQAEGSQPRGKYRTKVLVGSVHEAEVVNIMSYGASASLKKGRGLVTSAR